MYRSIGDSVGKEQFGIDTFVLPAVRYLQKIIPLREAMIQRIIVGDQKFSWSQSPMDMAELVAPYKSQGGVLVSRSLTVSKGLRYLGKTPRFSMRDFPILRRGKKNVQEHYPVLKEFAIFI
ncbi:hypothetical protein NGRA_1996 [Nosema granulosis]|uniref:Uncharacterized protein n=1 Tax=Nosema granulosis TaxID=83296 RepID=A0A9P6KY44_9MICR|nr:hypothetical protein NGRA_1996 [Nosema granulosis]